MAARHIIPARIPERRRQAAQQYALLAHDTLGCRHYSRTDFIWEPGDHDENEPHLWLLETNTLPGMTEHSLLPDAARAMGLALPDFVEHLVNLAL